MILIRKITFWSIILLFIGCSKPIEVIQEYDDNDNLIIEYQRRKDDFAKHGWYKRYYPTGELNEEVQYVDNRMEGQRKIYFKNGDIQVIETRVKDKFEGLYQSFYENGKLEQEGHYENNAMNGEWKFYYKKGGLREVVPFENNNENGAFKEYHPNGNLKTEGTYQNGNYEVGELKKYDESGTLIAKMNCEIRQVAEEKFSQCTTIWKAD